VFKVGESLYVMNGCGSVTLRNFSMRRPSVTRRKKRMKTKLNRIGLALAAMFMTMFAVMPVKALDGTNVTDILADNANNSINVFSPIALGLLGLGIVIGIIVWFLRKGKKG